MVPDGQEKVEPEYALNRDLIEEKDRGMLLINDGAEVMNGLQVGSGDGAMHA